MTADDTEPPRLEPAALVRDLLGRQIAGVLSTLSVRHGGAPFGSSTPFALSARGGALILISELAVHTANLHADPRASLFVAAPEADTGDPLAQSRVTLVGRAAPVPDADEPDARARYLARFPDAERTFGLGGFRLWEIHIE